MVTQVCVFRGDDAAPEAVDPVVELLEECTNGLEFVIAPVGEYASALDNGELPDPLRELIEDSETVLFGAASSRHTPVIGFLRYRYGGGTYANVRPIKWIPGAKTPLKDPTGIDYVIIRENLYGLYAGPEGDLSELSNTEQRLIETPHDKGKFAVRIMPEDPIQKLAAFACEYAQQMIDSGPVTITSATKSNVLPETDGLFDRVLEEEVNRKGNLEFEHLHADDAAQRLVTNPTRFDIIVAPNFAGDILSDLGAGTIGGLGLAPSGCYGDTVAYFEPVHGTAPDIAGQHKINPTAMLLSANMLLEYIGEDAIARELEQAVTQTYSSGEILTVDQGGSASTEEFIEALASNL